MTSRLLCGFGVKKLTNKLISSNRQVIRTFSLGLPREVNISDRFFACAQVNDVDSALEILDECKGFEDCIEPHFLKDLVGSGLTLEQFEWLLNVTKERNILNENCLGVLVTAMVKKSPEQNERILNFVANDIPNYFGTEGNAYIYGEALRACENVHRANEVWKEMEAKGIKPNWMCVNQLMHANFANQNYEAVLEIFEKYKDQVKYSAPVFATAMKSQIKSGNPRVARELYTKMTLANIDPDKNTVYHAIRADLKEGNIDKALIVYAQGMTHKIGPDVSQINMILESIVEKCVKDERLAAKALNLFDQAHANKVKLTEHSFKLLVDVFHRINRKFTMDMMFFEGVEAGQLKVWSEVEDQTCDLTEYTEGAARAAVRFVLNERQRSFLNYLEVKEKYSISSSPIYNESDSDSDSDEEIDEENVFSPDHEDTLPKIKRNKNYSKSKDPKIDALVHTPLSRFYEEINFRVNKYNQDYVGHLISTFHSTLKVKPVKGDKRLLKLTPQSIENWLTSLQKIQDFQKRTPRQKFEL